jgi:hypothetical protein
MMCLVCRLLVSMLLLLLLLLPPGEVAAEVERCSRYVVKLAGRLDSTIQVRLPHCCQTAAAAAAGAAAWAWCFLGGVYH